jgi:nickel transport protein
MLGLMGGAMLGSFNGSPEALALSEDEILQKLESVPVFTITDAEGSPLIASIPNAPNSEDARDVAGVFISAEDANRFVERLRQEQPEIADDIQVTVISLAEIYRLDRANASNNNPLEFSYVPTREEVEEAVSVLVESDREEELSQQNGEYIYPGVPLFLATAGPNQGYMTLEYEGEVVIPVFFDRSDLENVISRFREQQPEFADSVETEVIQLEGVLQTLSNEDNEIVEQLMFVPDSDSLEFVGNLLQQMDAPPSAEEAPAIELPGEN